MVADYAGGRLRPSPPATTSGWRDNVSHVVWSGRMSGVRATLTVDATMGWIRKLNIYGANGTVNLLLAYVLVRDAQGVGATGLRAKDFQVVRLNP